MKVGFSDVAVAAVVLLVGQQEVWAPAPGFGVSVRPLWLMSVVYAVTSVVLLARRAWPLRVLSVNAALLSTFCLVAGSPDGLGSLLPLLIGIFTVARYGTTVQLLLGVTITASAITVHELRDPRFTLDGRTAGVWAVIAAAGAVGAVLHQRSRDVRQAGVEAAAAERVRLFGELHDLVGHGMSLAVLQVVAAQTTLEQGHLPETEQRLAQLERTVRNTLQEVRRLLTVAGDGSGGAPLDPQPTLTELSGLVAGVRAAGLDVDLTVRVGDDVPPGVALSAYRVVQEALTNVMRHAHAAARVSVSDDGNVLLVSVCDDGPGGSYDGGSGIAGMRRRVELYGGRFDISRRPEGGTQVQAWLPR